MISKNKKLLPEEGGFKMKKLAKLLFPLFALALISIPAWAITIRIVKPCLKIPADGSDPLK
jgi:hypothetical protein